MDITDMDYEVGIFEVLDTPISLWQPSTTDVHTHYLREARHRLERGPAPSFVYLMLASNENPAFRPYVKIGVSTHPLRRLREVRKQVDSGNGPDWVPDFGSDEIQIIALFHGDRTTEKFLHQAFAAHRVCGEWFDLDPIENELIALIGRFALRIPDDLTEASLDDWEWVSSWT